MKESSSPKEEECAQARAQEGRDEEGGAGEGPDSMKDDVGAGSFPAPFGHRADPPRPQAPFKGVVPLYSLHLAVPAGPLLSQHLPGR